MTLQNIFIKIKLLRSISLSQYLYYNYFCKEVERRGRGHLIPYKNAKIEIEKGAKIILNEENLNVGIDKIKGSRAETYIRMKKNAIWQCSEGAFLFYGACVEVHENGFLETGLFVMNVGSTMICTKHIKIGHDVWMGRNIVTYDSDFHQMLDDEGNITNYPQEVIIGDRVWLTNQIMVQKGVHIGDGAVVSPFTTVRKDIEPETLVANGAKQIVVKNKIKWSSEKV